MDKSRINYIHKLKIFNSKAKGQSERINKYLQKNFNNTFQKVLFYDTKLVGILLT